MSVQELNALAHRYIDKAENEDLLEEVVRLLNTNDEMVQEPGMICFTEEGMREIAEAERRLTGVNSIRTRKL